MSNSHRLLFHYTQYNVIKLLNNNDIDYDYEEKDGDKHRNL
jgi:hypothetical protein